MGINKSGVCGMKGIYTIQESLFNGSFYACKIIDSTALYKTFFYFAVNFPNPFDAYFYLLENYKEGEIV